MARKSLVAFPGSRGEGEKETDIVSRQAVVATPGMQAGKHCRHSGSLMRFTRNTAHVFYPSFFFFPFLGRTGD